MDSFSRRKLLGNTLVFFIVLAASGVILYATTAANPKISYKSAILVCLGIGAVIAFFLWLGRLDSRTRLEAWARASGVNLVRWRGLPVWERPREWNFPTIEGNEIKAYWVDVIDTQGRPRSAKIAWHELLGPDPQVLWVSKAEK